MVASLNNRNTGSATISITVTVNGTSSTTFSGSSGSMQLAPPPFSSNGGGATEILPTGGETGTGQVSGNSMQQTTPLTVSSGTAVSTIAGYINQNPGQAKIAVTNEGEAFLVFGTSTAANGETMVETASPDDQDGTTSWTPLADFDKTVAYIDPGTGLKGSQLTALSGETMQGNVQQGENYTFNGYYKDPTTGEPMVSLTDADGQNVNLTTSQYGDDFGFATQDVIKNGLTPAAASTYQVTPLGGSSGTEGFSVGLDTTPQDVGNFLSKSQMPVLADDANGKTWLIDGVQTGANGQQSVTVQDPSNPSSGTTTMSLSSAVNAFHYFDRANGGVGTSFTAQSSMSGLQSGETYSYQGMSVGANGEAQVDLTDSDHMPVSVPFSEFSQAFGAKAQKNLLDSATSNLSIENDALGTSTNPNGVSWSTVSNSELFAASTNPYDITQGAYEGDCYLTSSMVAVEKQNPNALKQMIRPSTDGNPNDYDVRFFLPQSDGTMKPVWVTVNDQLASLSSGTLAGQATPTDPTNGKSQIGYALIEKAYGQLNQEYGTNSENGGYQGIAGGLPDQAITYLTGQQQTQVWPSSVGSGATWQALSQANNGTPVVVGTKQSNSPNDAISANMISGHAYTVLGTSTTSSGEQMVTLRNPWGQNTDNSGQPTGGNGIFTIPYSQLLQDMMYCTTPAASSTGTTTMA